MDNEILEIFRYISIESLSIAIVVFFLTMLIKWPIKNFTIKLIEEKRKAINIAIFLIPATLSFIMSLLYYGIFKSNWLTITIVNTAISSWIISLSIYKIYEKIITIIKGLKSGSIKLNSELASETIKLLQSSLKDLNLTLKEKEKKINNIAENLKSLYQIKTNLESNNVNKDIARLSATNIKIQELTNEEKTLQNQITNTEKQIKTYTQLLYVTKGD